MLYGKTTVHSIKILALILAVILSLVYSSVTVIRAENGIRDEQEHIRERAEAVERMRRGFEKFEESIDVSDLSITPDELSKLFADATKDTPYLFYVSNNLAYSYRTGGCVVAIKPKYTMEIGEAEAAVEYCRSEVGKIVDLIKHCESDLERLVRAHDLICANFAYDTSLESNNIFSFFKTRRGTCQGYTWTYMAVLRELGIECRYVASDSIAHIWLAVKIDGEWYHSDVTWDDPPSAEDSGKQSRAHLLFSDDKADADGYADRYCAVEIRCESKLYDANDLSSDIPFCTLAGDPNHDGGVTLYDLLLLRYYIEFDSETTQRICRMCADFDGDFDLDENDADRIRGFILNQ